MLISWRTVRPTLDLGLVAVASALRAPRGTAGAFFAIGRSAGWVAHALEQREAGHLLRPRARYVGRPAETSSRIASAIRAAPPEARNAPIASFP